MNSKFKIIETYGIWLLDLVCILVSYRIARLLRYGSRYGRSMMRLQNPFNQMLIIFILFCVAYNFFLDWNHDYLTRGSFREFIEVLKYNVAMLLTAGLYVFLTRQYYYVSRMVVGQFLVFNFVLMLVLHILVKRILRSVLHGEMTVTKVMVIAEPELMAESIRAIRTTLGVNTQIVAAAFAEDASADGEKTEVEGVQVLAGLDGITEAMIQIPFDEVFINTPDISQRKLRNMIAGFSEMGVVCHYNLELRDLGRSVSEVGNYGGFSVITYRNNFVSAKKLAVKRAIDILGGLVGLVLTGILTLFIAPAIRIESKGPVFFSQTRVGKNGRRFKIYKFRSMYQDAEERKKDLMKNNEMNGLMFKMENDPRVTKVGNFLRKTSLDEFPQFLNILKGDMSLVGTRPPTEKEFEQYNEHYRRRISMTPGLTGMWQVSGRSDITDFDEVVKLDLEYIDNWSLLLDIKIILQTVAVIFTHRGAK